MSGIDILPRFPDASRRVALKWRAASREPLLWLLLKCGGDGSGAMDTSHPGTDGMLVLNRGQCVALVNPAAATLLGTTADELLAYEFGAVLADVPQEIEVFNAANRTILEIETTDLT